MPIPKHAIGGTLPPFLGKGPGGEHASQSPYRATMAEVTARFATSERRRTLCAAFLRLRGALRAAGLSGAVQWVDGSFVDRTPREPNDIDVITLLPRPMTSFHDANHLERLMSLSDRERVKAEYLCDHFFVEIDPAAPIYSARLLAYWYGLFSHQRETFTWRGLVEVALDDDDNDAKQVLEQLDVQAKEKTEGPT